MKYYTHLSAGRIQVAPHYNFENKSALFGVNAQDINAVKEVVSFQVGHPDLLKTQGSVPFISGKDGAIYIPVNFHNMHETGGGGTLIEASTGAILVAQSLKEVTQTFNEIGQEAPSVVQRHKPMLERFQEWRQNKHVTKSAPLRAFKK